MMRARRGAAPRDASPSSPRGRHRDAASSPPPPATPRRGGATAVGTWECCICWEAQPAPPPRSARRAGVAKLQSQCGLNGDAAAAGSPVLLPEDSACGHGCCARCLRAYVASVVTSAARQGGAAASGGAASPHVLCPGVDARTPAGWDARCHVSLPPALLAPLLPRRRSVVAEALSLATAWARAALAAALPLFAHRAAMCPWCGAAGEGASRGRGAAARGNALVVRCSACGRHRCGRCGSRLARRSSTRCAACRASGLRLAAAMLALMLSTLLALLWRPAAALLAARAHLRAGHGLQPPEPRGTRLR